jgi:sulfur carrier protein
MTVLVLINGEPRELPAGMTLAAAVASLPGTPQGRGVAVALDGEVVPRGAWPRTQLTEGAHVEVVAAVQGG